ncbi:MAG TPA: CdvA-like protein [Methylomirabilota bacterium]|nr:CdvA-like protein [Methylomirabilota bacterium]
MTTTVEQVGKYLGKTIEDAMGRPVGKLVGLTADLKDEVTAIQIAHSDGEVAQHPITFVKVLEDRLILMQTWRVDAEDLRKEHDIVMRRRQALDLLLKDGDIEKPEYDHLRTSYEELDGQIKERRETLLDTLKHVDSKLGQQIAELQGVLTNNKMLYSSAEIDEQTYHTVTESIRSGLEISRKERKDIENITQYLNGIDSIVETPKEPIPPQPKNPLSDVVVIKLNELT